MAAAPSAKDDQSDGSFRSQLRKGMWVDCLTSAGHWRVAELLDVGGGSGDCDGPLIHFVDWPSQWDQRVAVGSGLICRLLPLRSASRGYTGPPSRANKEGVKESFERRVAEKVAQQRDEPLSVASDSLIQAEADEKESGAVKNKTDPAATSPSSEDGQPSSLSQAAAEMSRVRKKALPKSSPKPSGWELKNGEWVRRLKDPLAVADAADGAACGCVGVSPIPSSSPTRTPFNITPSMRIARCAFLPGERLGGCSGATSPQTAPPQSGRGHDDTKADEPALLRRTVASSVSRFCSAIKESLRVDEEEEKDSGSDCSDDDSSSGSDSSSEDSEDSELQRLHPSSSDSPISSEVEEPLSAAESDRESAAEESSGDHEAVSDEEEGDEEADGSEEVDDPNEIDGLDEIDAPNEVDEPNEVNGSNEEQKADKTAEPIDDAVRRVQRPAPFLAVARVFQRRQAAELAAVPTLASFEAEERKGDVDRGQKSGSGSEPSPPKLECPSATPLASTPAASLKPASAAQPKSAFEPPPASLATMARQSRKIVKQCPSSRVAVLGPRGSGRSSLINLLCSATNTTPNDPHVSTRAHAQRSATAVTTHIKAHTLNAQIKLVDAGCFTPPAALGAFLDGKLPDGCRDSEAMAHLTAAPSASRVISGALLVWSAEAAAAERQEIEMAQLLRAVSGRGIPFVLVVTHCDSVVPLADLQQAAPSATRPLFEHAQMQLLIADVAACTGVNTNQIFPVANYSSQRRRQYPLERNGVLALAQLAKQISEGRKFAPTAAPPPPPPRPLPTLFTRLVRATNPLVQKAGPVNGPVAGASAAGAASKAAEANPWRPLLTPVKLEVRVALSATDIKGQLAQTQMQTAISTSAAQTQPQPELQPMTDPAAPSAASTAISLQLHLRGQSDDGERKETETPLSSAPAQPVDGSLSETSRSVTPLLTAGPSSAPLLSSSPRSARSSHSADSTASDSSWDQWDSPPPADAQQQRAD